MVSTIAGWGRGGSGATHAVQEVAVSLPIALCHLGGVPDTPAIELPTRLGRGGLALGWTFAVLVLYALSPGPVLALWADPPVGISAFYLPLEKLFQTVPIVHSFYEWYFKLWGV